MFAEIIIHAKIPLGAFTYLVPSELANEVKIGQLVLVNFNGKKCMGLVISFKKNVDHFKCKPIIKIIDYNPLNNIYLDLIKWISEYYFCSLSESFRAIVPEAPLRKIDLKQKNNNTTATNNKPQNIFIAGLKTTRFKYYEEIIKKNISCGKKTIVCLASIEEATTISNFFNSKKTAIYHSKLSKSEKFSIYQKAKSGELNLIFGVRSAVFLPLADLETIIVDDPDAISQFSDQKPYLSTIKIAQRLSLQLNLKLIVGNIIPDAYYWNLHRKKQLILISDEFIKKTFKNIEIVSTKNEWVSVLNQTSRNEILQNIKDLKKVFIFYPKNNGSVIIMCKDCNEIVKCEKCGKNIYLEADRLECRYCLFKSKTMKKCKKCKGSDFKKIGWGKDSLHQELELIDINWSKYISIGSFDELDNLENTYDAIIALDFESIINKISFNQEEKLFVFLMKLSTKTNNKIIMQINESDNPIIQDFARKKIREFLDKLLDSRKKYHLPPFGKIAIITCGDNDKDKAFSDMNNYIDKLSKIPEISISGPFQNDYFRKNYLKYFQIQIKFVNESQKQMIIHDLPKTFYFQIQE
ncbi:MAG: hypothetical protein WCW17_03075 [Patescibacteria group bacterium]|jgi:primosomal protein N' (replication factor Y)